MPPKAEVGQMTIYTLEEHARKKGMWAGAVTKTTINGLQGLFDKDGGLELQAITRDHTPAVLKCFDESIVNAQDHHVACRANTPSQRVKRIAVRFWRDPNGDVWFSAENDGPGLAVMKHEKATEIALKGGNERAKLPGGINNVEVAFCQFLGGDNLDRDPHSVKGGTNGIGAKLAGVHSYEETVETVDINRKVLYRQRYHDRLRSIDPPVITKTTGTSAATKELTAEEKAPHTKVTYRLAFDQLGYAVGKAVGNAVGSSQLPAQDFDDIEAWIRLRCHQSAAYVGDKCVVTFNGKVCETNSAEKLAKLYCKGLDDVEIQTTVLKGDSEPYSNHPWQMALAISPSIRKFNHVSVLSGVVTAKGQHLTYLKRLVNETAQKKLQTLAKDRKKQIKATESLKHAFMVVCGPLPGAEWGGQRKDELQVPEATIRHYAPTAAFLNRAGESIAKIMYAETASTKQRKVSLSAIVYEKANEMGPKNKNATLLLGEGDSALTLINSVLTGGKSAKNAQPKGARSAQPKGARGASSGARPPPSKRDYGTYSLQGVVMNALQNVNEIRRMDGSVRVEMKDKLRDNIRLQGLVSVLGLTVGEKYTPAKIAKLPYPGGVILCTDQDLDGTGKILPLVALFLFVMWPELISHGYIGEWVTDVVRAYEKKANGNKGALIKGFKYEPFAVEWLNNERALGVDTHKKYLINFYKGLAAHDKGEANRMRESFQEDIIWFTADNLEDLRNEFEIYYGSSTAPRKMALRTPVEFPSPDAMLQYQREQKKPMIVHLQTDSKAYKQEAVIRQIPGVVDGLKPAQRKILEGSIRLARSSKQVRKVFQHGGSIAEHEFYHHGDMSLNSTIVYMAQSYPGARKFPLLEGHGMFGTYKFGGKDAGSARYIGVRLRSPLVNALFPDADRYLLDYVFEDGERAEPAFYVPVLPRAVLETGHFPSEGWNFDAWARDFEDVGELVLEMIRGEASPELLELADQFHLALGNRAANGSMSEPAPESGIPTLEQVLQSIREEEELRPLSICTRNFSGRLNAESTESFGTYIYYSDLDAIRVTSLTLVPTGGSKCGSTAKFIKWLEAPFVGKEKKKTNPLHEFIELPLENDSPENGIDVLIRLKPGAWERINAEYGNDIYDPVEDFLKLHDGMKAHINLVANSKAIQKRSALQRDALQRDASQDATQPVDGSFVLEFGESYLAPILFWFPVRREFYRLRFERERVILQLKIFQEEETLRYIPRAEALGIAKIADETAAEAVLQREKFQRFASGVLRSPEYTAAREPERLREIIINGPQACYDYLLNLRERDLLKSAVQSREKRLATLRSELAEVEKTLGDTPFPGASVWAKEVEKCLQVMRAGIESEWSNDE